MTRTSPRVFPTYFPTLLGPLATHPLARHTMQPLLACHSSWQLVMTHLIVELQLSIVSNRLTRPESLVSRLLQVGGYAHSHHSTLVLALNTLNHYKMSRFASSLQSPKVQMSGLRVRLPCLTPQSGLELQQQLTYTQLVLEILLITQMQLSLLKELTSRNLL